MNRDALFFTRPFFPLFWVQFLGAFNDNVFKSALVMLIVFKLADSPEEAAMLSTVAAGVFILPFFLFSAYAGYLADTLEKSHLIRRIKLAEVAVMALGAWALLAESLFGLLGLLFLMGAQSAFFGPVKYAILPDLLSRFVNRESVLNKANGWFSAATFMAILVGTLVGGWLMVQPGFNWIVPALVIGLAVIGWLVSYAIPTVSVEGAKAQTKPFLRTWASIQAARAFPNAFMAILAISWFWFLGASYLSQLPIMVKTHLQGDESAVLLFLATFSVGMGIGAWLINVLMRVFPRVRLLHFHGLLLGLISLVIMASSLLLLREASSNALASLVPLALGDNLQGAQALLSQPNGLGVWVSLLIIAILGGAYSVPLYTRLQISVSHAFRGQMIGVNNIVNALLMVMSSLFFLVGYQVLTLDLPSLFLVIAFVNLLVAAWVHVRFRSAS